LSDREKGTRAEKNDYVLFVTRKCYSWAGEKRTEKEESLTNSAEKTHKSRIYSKGSRREGSWNYLKTSRNNLTGVNR